MRAIRTLCLAAVLGFAAVGAQAKKLGLSTGATQTLGSSHYAGTSVYAKFKKGDYSIKPSYSQYHSDFSSGTYKTLSLRGAYDTKALGIGATLGGTPKINGYSNVFVGLDAIVSITPTGGKASKRIRGAKEQESGARGSGLARIDLGGGVTYTQHRDDLQASSRGRSATLHLGQTDFTASAGVEVLDNWFSVDVTKSVYGHDLGAVSARDARVAFVTGLSSTIQGFPSSSVSLRYELEAWPVLVPYASYTRTTFVSASHSDAVRVGAYAELAIAEVGVSYERYVQPGRPGQNYYSLSAALRF